MGTLMGLVASFGYVGLVLGVAALLAKCGWERESTRKLAHIALGGWWPIAMVFFASPLWAAVPPTLFVLVNWFAYRTGRLRMVSRGKGQDTPGTVYYALSLLVLALYCFGPGVPYAGALGVFAMAFGDGLAGLAGQRVQSRRFCVAGEGKSLAGALAMFAATTLACGAVLALFMPRHWWMAPVLGLFACGLELFSPRGLDNLTVPLGVTMLYMLMAGAAGPYTGVFAGALLSAVVVLAAWAKGLLTLPAGGGAVAVGVAMYAFGGPALWALMIWFFGSANLAASLLRRGRGAAKRKKEGPRRLRQVLANGLPALLFAGLYQFTGQPWLMLAAAGALAACTADTWASEIGIYSRAAPVDILTRKPVARGLSGGASPLGLVASGLAAVATAFLAMLLFYWMDPALPTGPLAFLLVAVCGMGGSLIDSVLGATVQAKYRVAGSARLTEEEQGGGDLVAGVRWVTNDLVNLLSPLAAAVLVAPLLILLV